MTFRLLTSSGAPATTEVFICLSSQFRTSRTSTRMFGYLLSEYVFSIFIKDERTACITGTGSGAAFDSIATFLRLIDLNDESPQKKTTTKETSGKRINLTQGQICQDEYLYPRSLSSTGGPFGKASPIKVLRGNPTLN